MSPAESSTVNGSQNGDGSKHVLFIPLDSYGHVNSCVGIAEKLFEMGHRITFALEKCWEEKFKKSYKNFNIILYTDPSRTSNESPNDHWIKSIEMIYDTLHYDSLYKAKHQNLQEFEEFVFNELHYDDQIAEIIEKIQPDVMVVDNYFTVPAVLKSGRRWVFMTSATPLSVINHPDTPPTGCGYPTDGDRKQWEVFQNAFDEHHGEIAGRFINKLRELGLPELPSDGGLFHPSPYLNIYPYPIELDYLDIRPLPDKWKRFDHFIRSSDETKSFQIPEKLKNLPGKLIYVSMGSMGCAHTKLLKRLMNILSLSPNRFIMVLGPDHKNIQLPSNIWGDHMLPQVEILPLVDLVITHGGNNSVLETLYFGKPMIINPMFCDQYDNAQRIKEKGYGDRINAYQCEPEDLLGMIENILNDNSILERCKRIGERMRSSNSTEKCAKAIIDVCKMNLID